MWATVRGRPFPGKEENIMWIYEKRLEYPVNITKTCPKTAQLIISQYGGPDGELSASMRYLAQRYTMPDKRAGDLLTDIGTEELAHMEIICAMVMASKSGLPPAAISSAALRMMVSASCARSATIGQ